MLTVGIAHSDPPPPSADVKLPYVVSVYNDGEPVTGTSELTVRVYESPDSGALLVYEERFDAVSIFEGELSLTIGTGIALQGQLGVAEVAAHPDLAVELVVDDAVIAARQRMGSVPRSFTARSVPANGILYGGDHGLVPAEAITRPIIVDTQIYASGATISQPEGYMCTYTTRLPGKQVPIEGTADELSGSDMWISFVDELNLNLLQMDPFKGLAVGMTPYHSTPVDVHAQRLTSTCGLVWNSTCKWTAYDVAMSVEVTSYCIPIAI